MSPGGAVDRQPIFGVATVVLILSGSANASDLPGGLTSASATTHDWAGVYVGAYVGYGTGSSNWTANPMGAPGGSLSGSVDLFSRAGGYLGGFVLGYNYHITSDFVLGVETDVAFPNYLNGATTLASPLTGQASYGEAVTFSGTVRARIGYAFGDWLAYGTGGFALTYDQLTRTQLIGTPGGGVAVPGTMEFSMLARTGWAAGAGVEFGFAPNWTASLEYLFTDYGSHQTGFAQGAQVFDADLAVHEMRLGLNYRLGGDGAVQLSAPAAASWAIHGQTTFVTQAYPSFRSPYEGTNSLPGGGQGRETWDATLFAGVRLWQGAELWINPEIDQGFGLGDTLGVAGFPSGEAYKLGTAYPLARVPRAFVRQTLGLGGETEEVVADINQFAATQPHDRLVITVGKFSVVDIFDTNRYAHDPRGDFLNWSVIEAGTFDYAADAWGYTYGGAVEWYRDRWTLRGGLFDLSIVPNSTNLDPTFSEFQGVLELEERHELSGQPGKLKITGFLSCGRMGSFADAITLAEATGQPADIAAVRQWANRGGVSLNLEQQVSNNLGFFARAGIANGNIEPYEFTDIDRTVSAGLQVAGKPWGRPDDTLGLSGVVNGISGVHETFLNAGGLGILVGDGQLPHPGLEQIVETYYSLPIASWHATLDYQFVVNPAYNRDRGPVSVFGVRMHAQF
jgi:high affinity Mn2+ porin